MANGLLLQYVNKCKNDYKHFIGVSSLPSFELILKHISLSDANASGWGVWATHRFDFQSQSHSIEVWEDLWKPQLHGDYVIFHELTHLLDTENLVNGDKKKNTMMRGFLEYHASQIETIKILGYESFGENISFSMKQQVESIVLLSHKSPDSHIDVKVEFGEGEEKVPLDKIAERAKQYQPAPRVTYKMIQEYIEEKYGFKVHTAYIAEVKRNLGLPMYDAPNMVEELKQPRRHPTAEKVEAIKDALKHFGVI